MSDSAAEYLAPYRDAAARHGGAFASLLWANPQTQAVRFDAIRRACDLRGKSILDVGCGRADLLVYLRSRRIPIADYIGIEAVDALADVAEQKLDPGDRIIRADFIREPVRMFVGADVVIVSGSLNTTDDARFYPTLRRAFDAAAQTLVFNFLCSPQLAASAYLRWRHSADVLAFVATLGASHVEKLADYLAGDCTVIARR